MGEVLDTNIRICPYCQLECKGPLALQRHKRYSHSDISVPLFRGKMPNRAPMASELKDALEKSSSQAEAARLLGITWITFRKWCQILIPLEYEEFKKTATPYNRPKSVRVNYPYYKKLMGILEGTVPTPKHWSKSKFQKLLIREGLIEEKCEVCGFDERRVIDYKVPIMLDFIDGNGRNWKRENLRILCFNHFFLMVRNFIARELNLLK